MRQDAETVALESVCRAQEAKDWSAYAECVERLASLLGYIVGQPEDNAETPAPGQQGDRQP